MPHSLAKMNLKSAAQKLEFVMVRAISKSYTQDCSCKFPSFSIKTILCENTNIRF